MTINLLKLSFNVYMSKAIAEIRHFRKCLVFPQLPRHFQKCLGSYRIRFKWFLFLQCSKSGKKQINKNNRKIANFYTKLG